MTSLRATLITICALLLLGSRATAGGVGTDYEPVPAPDSAAAGELKALADAAVAAGFPDARGARLFSGELIVRQAEGGAEVRIEGVHALTRDGTWMVMLYAPLRAGGTLTVDTTQLQEIDAARRSGIVEGGNAAHFVDYVIRSFDLSTARCVLPSGNQRVWSVLRIDQSPYDQPDWETDVLDVHARGAAASVTLMRAGLFAVAFRLFQSTEVHRFSDRSAASRFRPTWLELAGVDHVIMVKRPGELAPISRAQAAFDQAVTQNLRYALCDWFASNLLDLPAPFTAIPRNTAVAGARALLPAGDAQALAELDLLERSSRLPPASETGGKGIPPAQRLVTWRTQGLVAYPQADAWNARLTWLARSEPDAVTEWRDFAATCTASAWTRDDLPQLVALLRDPGASRWQNHRHPCTVGDQALRAIAAVLRCDPRVLIGRDPNAEWTTAERSAVVDGITAWWAAHRNTTLEQMRAEAMSRMDDDQLADLVTAVPQAEVGPLLAQLAQLWKSRAPTDYSRQSQSQPQNDALFVCGIPYPEFPALLEHWPLDCDPGLLPLWKLAHGDADAGTRYFEEYVERYEHGYWHSVRPPLGVLAYRPRPAAIQRFGQILTLDPNTQERGQVRAEGWVPCALLYACITVDKLLTNDPYLASDPLYDAWASLGTGTDRAHIRRQVQGFLLLFVPQLLRDLRPAPRDIMPAWEDPTNALTDDVRIADLCCRSIQSAIAQLQGSADPQLAFDVSAPLAARDEARARIYARLRTILPSLLATIDPALPSPRFPAFDAPVQEVGADGF